MILLKAIIYVIRNKNKPIRIDYHNGYSIFGDKAYSDYKRYSNAMDCILQYKYVYKILIFLKII